MTRLEVIKRYVRLLLPFPSAFKTPRWLFLGVFYVFFGAIVNPILPGVLLVASLASIGVLLGGIVSTYRQQRMEGALRRAISSVDRARSLLDPLYSGMIKIEVPQPVLRPRLSRMQRFKAWIKNLLEFVKSLIKPLIIVAIIAVLVIAFMIFVAPHLGKFLISFVGYLASNSSALATFLVSVLSSITFVTMLIVVLSLPIHVINEIDDEKLEFGILGTVLLTISDVLVLIEGMQGISVHYPSLYSVATVGMWLSVVCLVCSWTMCSSLLTRGMTRRSLSHLFLAITLGTYAAITMLYATTELLGLLLGLIVS